MSEYVYFIEAFNNERRSHVKIGVSNNIESRIKELQCGNHLRLALMGKIKVESRVEVFKLESAIHSKLREFNSSGEWYFVTPKEIRKAITSIRKDGLFEDEVKFFVYG